MRSLPLQVSRVSLRCRCFAGGAGPHVPRPGRYAVAGAAAVFGGVCAWRVARDRFLGSDSSLKPPRHADPSSFGVVSPPLLLVEVHRDGSNGHVETQPLRFSCTASELHALRAAVASEIHVAKSEILEQGRENLDSKLQDAFSSMHGRVVGFADWYFKYQTTYKLLLRALGAASRHLRGQAPHCKLSDFVQEELEGHICEQFMKLVLWPEASEAECVTAFRGTVELTRKRFEARVGEAIQRHAQPLLDRQGAEMRLDAPTVRIEMSFDWRAQAYKAQRIAASYDKGPEITVGLVAAGAAVGKAVGGKVAASVGTKAMSAFGSKLAAPLVGKVMSLVGPGTVGVCAAAAGPLGALAGAAAGLAADMMISYGNELVHRETFEADGREVVCAIQREWKTSLSTELDLAVEGWCMEAVELVSASSDGA